MSWCRRIPRLSDVLLLTQEASSTLSYLSSTAEELTAAGKGREVRITSLRTIETTCPRAPLSHPTFTVLSYSCSIDLTAPDLT